MNTSEQIQWLNRNCSDGGFLQSEGWRALLEYEGFHTEHFEREGLWVNVVEYQLPIIGRYWYVPRGPVFENEKLKIKNEKWEMGNKEQGTMSNEQVAVSEKRETQGSERNPGFSLWREMLQEAKKRGVGWVRVEPGDEEELAVIREWSTPYEIEKALHDMQPREILVVDISKSEEEILAGMKAKTRYNVRLAEKRGVLVSFERDKTAIREFLQMIRETAKRNGIATHSEEHYLAFFETFPRESLELFVARHEGRILAAILVSFFGDTATYLHGASSNDDRGFMAPFLLQFRAIQEAKKRGCVRYDFGGVDTTGMRPTLSGVTRFKLGFAESVKTVQYPGSYDRVLVPSRFHAYRLIALSKMFVKRAIRSLTKI